MKLPVVSGSETVKAFRKVGYEFDEQHGCHSILRHAAPPHRRFSVPNHKELAKGTHRALIREAGLAVDESTRLLEDRWHCGPFVGAEFESRLGLSSWGAQSIEATRSKGARPWLPKNTVFQLILSRLLNVSGGPRWIRPARPTKGTLLARC
jgi:predicted RNA binding protein YcfA (HicA-like mRNA interferase family)